MRVVTNYDMCIQLKIVLLSHQPAMLSEFCGTMISSTQVRTVVQMLEGLSEARQKET